MKKILERMPGPGPGAGGGYPRIFFKKNKNTDHLYFHMVYFLDVGVDFNQWSKPYFYTLLGPVQQAIAKITAHIFDFSPLVLILHKSLDCLI